MKIGYSGGQAGVDIAAVDALRELGIDYGGWIPKGRRSENGPISKIYASFKETDTASYTGRTLMNIRDTDVTVIFIQNKEEAESGGTNRTIRYAAELGKSIITIDFSKPFAESDYQVFKDLLAKFDKVNFAGPRESKSLGIYKKVKEYMLAALR